MIEIIPAILENNFPEIQKKIYLVEGLVDWVQIDIADNTLVPNSTFLNPEPFKKLIAGDANEGSHDELHLASEDIGNGAISQNFVMQLKRDHGKRERQDPLKLELHMMVKNPLKYLESFAKAGFKRFYAHVEGDFVPEYIEKCNSLGVEAGLAIDGPSDFEKIHKYMYDLDCILVMAIEAGFSGKPFREDTVEKIKKIREVDFEIPIAVDGAMIPENAKKVIAAGATRINSNSFIFNAPDVKIAIEQLKAING